MCEFCEGYNSSGGGSCGKPIKINKCAHPTDLTDCNILIPPNDKPCIVIFAHGAAKGYMEAEYCFKCGRKLSEVEES